jgi:hypothetical protein
MIVRRPSGLSEDEQADLRWLGQSYRARIIMELSVSGPCSRGGMNAERFHSGGDGRTYFEIDRELCKVCKVHSHVFNMLGWMQENYIAHCEKGPDKHKRPRNVRFAVLACEWEQKKLVADKKHKQQSTVRKSSPKKSPKSIAENDMEILEAMNALTLESVYRGFSRLSNLPVVFGDEGESSYKFTFRMSHDDSK